MKIRDSPASTSRTKTALSFVIIDTRTRKASVSTSASKPSACIERERAFRGHERAQLILLVVAY